MTPAQERLARVAVAAAALALFALAAWLALLPRQPAHPPLAWDDIAPPADAAIHPWRWIVVHHSATSEGDTTGFDRSHLARQWEGVGYHFVIGNGRPMVLGRIDATFRWRLQRPGAHAGAAPEQSPYNQDGLGICLVGDFSQGPPDPLQEDRLAELCAMLVHHIPTLSVRRIIAHREVPGKATACPGRIDLDRLRYRVGERLRAQGLTVR
jgi:N-acetyl-anhydromuramyl-L-alanine amidase AmpD